MENMETNAQMNKDAAAIQDRKSLSKVLAQSANLPTDQSPIREEDLTDLTDYARQRQDIFDRVQKSVEDNMHVANDKFTLRATDLRYTGSAVYGISDHKKAVLEGRSLTRKLTGAYEIVDNATGKVVGKTGRKTIMNVPYLTDQGTFVRSGTDLKIPFQLRMRPGVYTHFTADNYPEAQFNIKPGTGNAFRTFFEPETSIFYLTHKGRKVPLYPVLKEMGVQDQALKAVWGDAVYTANAETHRSAHAARWINEMRTKLAGPVEKKEEVEDDTLPVSPFQEDTKPAEGD